MKSVFRRQLLVSSIMAGTTLAFATPALAQAAEPASPTSQAPSADAPPADVATDDQSGDVVVTGTLISNPNLVTSSPVNVTTSDEIELRQSNVAEDILRDIPGVAANVGSSTNNGNGGASFADLRGLGPNRNIVLLDGTRIVPANLNGNVDLNNIPLALLERVDILTGGASTTYGADAVSGVVNFITKRDFAGIDLSLGEQITERGDGNVFRADLTIGANFDDGRGNAVLSLGYQESDPVFFAGERPLSNDTLDSFDGTASGASGTSVPSRFSVIGGGTQQIDPTTGALVPTYSLFNFNPYNIFQTPFQRFNLFSSARYEVSDQVEVYSQGLFSQNTVDTIIAPSGAFGAPLLVPINNPFLPTATGQTLCQNNIDLDPAADVFDDDGNVVSGILRPTAAQCTAAAAATGPGDPNYLEAPTNVSRRLAEAGGRVSSYKTQIFNFKAGLRGTFSDALRYDVYGAYGESENTQTIQNYVFTPRLQQALRAVNATTCVDPSSGCVPVNLFGPQGTITPEAVNFLLVPATSGNRTSLAQVRGILTYEVGSIGAAEPISIAAGAEYRKYTAEVFADTLAQDPGALGGAGGATVPVTGGYDVVEGFGELIAPLVADAPLFHSLTLEAGVRYSSYSVDAPNNPSFNTWTYKGGLSWEPIESLKIRGNYQRAVRAPNIGELFSPTAVGLTNLRTDPCQGDAPVNNALLRAVCIAQGASPAAIGNISAPSAGQINATFSTSANNRPEKADTFTVGAIFQPDFVPGLSISLDYYNIKIKDALTPPKPGDTIGACFGNLTAASATDPLCTQIRRDPATGGLDGDASTTPGLPSPTTNSGRLATDGLDLVANFKTDLTDGIALGLSFNGNYTFSSKFQASPGGLNRECVGYYSVNCSFTGSILPQFSFNQRTTLSFDTVDVSLLWRHISGTEQEPFDADPNNFGSNGPAFADYRKVDAYDWFDFTTRFGVNEHFDLTLTVQNLLDKDPPSLGSNIGSTTFNSGNTFPSTYDALGRRYAIGARVKF